ncbi:hypothetical protein [Streptomyces malaysiensis]|uniref:Uncharacterized protein n=1 Tax=Streptomyces malaysiensis TaxID=92644 RepID=A0A7X6AXA3_STRMQ|nr:hypothetical protein [Streptomyces malaysiensis]NIY65540.1 hypothetical protein [Streptomyces malaysiensis]
MRHAAVPDRFDSRLIWALLLTFLPYGLLLFAVDGSGEPLHHLTQGVADFVLGVLDVVRDAQGCGQ